MLLIIYTPWYTLFFLILPNQFLPQTFIEHLICRRLCIVWKDCKKEEDDLKKEEQMKKGDEKRKKKIVPWKSQIPIHKNTLYSNYKTDFAPGFTSDCHGRCFETLMFKASLKGWMEWTQNDPS